MMSQLPNELFLMLIQAMRNQPPLKVKEVRRIPVEFDHITGVMFPHYSWLPWIRLTDGEMPLKIMDDVPECKKMYIKRVVKLWENLMNDPDWHFVKIDKETDTDVLEGVANDGESTLPVGDDDVEAHSRKYFYDKYAIFHRY